MKKLLLLATIFFAGQLVFAQKKPAYALFDSKGKRVQYGKMLKAAAASDVVLFGEFHNNPIAHWLQLELIKDLKQQKQMCK